VFLLPRTPDDGKSKKKKKKPSNSVKRKSLSQKSLCITKAVWIRCSRKIDVGRGEYTELATQLSGKEFRVIIVL
jgi:hypothetical protein